MNKDDNKLLVKPTAQFRRRQKAETQKEMCGRTRRRLSLQPATDATNEKRLLAINTLLLSCCAVLLTACGGGGDRNQDAQQTKSSSAPQIQGPAQTAKYTVSVQVSEGVSIE